MYRPLAGQYSADSTSDMAIIRSLGTEIQSLHHSGMYLMEPFWPGDVLNSNGS